MLVLLLCGNGELVFAAGMNQEQQGFFIGSFAEAFNLILNFDSELFFVVWTSLWVAFISVLVSTFIAIPLGVLVALKNFFGKTFLLSVLNTLMAMPTVLVGLLIYGLLHRQGVFGGWSLLYTPFAIICGQAVLITPLIWNLSIAAVGSADPRLALTCQSLGASFFQQAILHIRETRFALVAAVIVGAGRAIGEIGIAMMLGGNIKGLTRTMTTSIALETSKGEFEFAIALGLILLLISFFIYLLLQHFQRIK